jgi:hypothetical protein
VFSFRFGSGSACFVRGSGFGIYRLNRLFEPDSIRSPLVSGRDSPFSGSAGVLQCLRRLQVLHLASDLAQSGFCERINLEPLLVGDVLLVDRIAEMVLRFHQ